MMKNNILLVFILTFTLSILEAQNNQYFIYGKIYTEDKDVYTGPIRWGKEEVFWSDIFNSSKGRNPYLKYLSWEESKHLKDKDNSATISTIFGDINFKSSKSTHVHEFAISFGDIKSLKPIFSDNVEIMLKNGTRLEVGGGSNDIGGKIQIIDEEMGKMEIKWDKIEKVEFIGTPSSLSSKFGNPIYGKVETDNGLFEGLVQWDHDERIDTDKIEGDYKDSEVCIKLKKIKSIEKSGKGSHITFVSERKVFLTGSNDVNYKNRGVIVWVPDEGRFDIPWGSFKKVDFFDAPKNIPNNYSDYLPPKRLNGTIETQDNKTYEGLIVFDLDEIWDFEMLNGKLGEIELSIPFRQIKSIQPKNSLYSLVTLKTGKTYLLGGKRDVTDRNDGILLFQTKENTKYIFWEEVKKITFK